MTNKQLAAKVEALGATFEFQRWPDGSAEFCAIAPDGKQWVDGQCIHLLSVYHSAFKNARKDAIDIFIDRISDGLEDLDEKING